MITQQLRTGDVLNKPLLALYQDIPRDIFVPSAYKPFAYSDMQIELPHQQRMMTPLEEGKLLQALDLKGHEVVLEIGTGTGFLTAMLSRLCKKVISVEYFPDIAQSAKQHLAQAKCNNVELLTGDGIHGWVDAAPYDVMIISGAIDAIDDTLRLQIAPGGKLFAIVGQAPVMQAQLHELDAHGQWQQKILFETNLPELINEAKSKEFVF